MKKLILTIPPSRLASYILMLVLLPLFFAGYFYMKEKNKWNTVSDRIVSAHALSKLKARKQSLNTTIRKKYGETDCFYLDNQVEPLIFLKKEREALENLIENPAFTGNEVAEKRYSFLLGEANRLQFTEGSVRSEEGVQDTIEILAHPVEVDTQDLKELLIRIEGNRPGKPLLLVTDFKLDKKVHTNGNQVFKLNLKLLKREFTK